MLMNSNALPVALMQSRVMSVPDLEWDDGDGHEDDPTAMLGRALTYLVLFSSLGMILRYSYGMSLLSAGDDVSSQDSTLQDEEAGYQTNATSPSVREGTLVDISTDEQLEPQPLEPRPPRALSMKKANSAQESLQEGYPFSGYTTEITDGSTQQRNGTLPLPASTSSPTQRFFSKIWNRIRSFVRAVTDVMTPPLYASVLSLVVALIPPLQHALELHTAPIKGALENAGDCSIPLTLVVLGGYFYTPPKQTESKVASSQVTANGSSRPIHAGDHSSSAISLASKINGSAPAPDSSGADGTGRKAPLSDGFDESKPGETKAVIVALISRMIIVPILMLPLFMLSTITDWQDVFADPVFVLSCVLLASAPPAVTLAQIASKTSGDAFERLISRIMFWGYCFVTPPATIFYVVLGLWLAKL